MKTRRVDPWCCPVVELAARLLPVAYRERYALEFIAELYDLPRGRQVRHSLGVLASTWRLRKALPASQLTSVEGVDMNIAFKRPLRCRVGVHRWHPMSTTDGQRYEACLLCGKDRGERFSGFVSGGSGMPSGGVG